MPKLIARERFFYAGRNVEAGEEFEASPQDVPLLTNAISPKARDPQVLQDDAAAGDSKKRRYNRRDLRSED